MKLVRELVFVGLLIFVITWNVLLAYLMVNYVNEVNKIGHCSTLAPDEGNVIQLFGSFKLVVLILMLFMGVLSIFASLMK
mgnify:CR=1 FL=1|tara:strand:- start:595 stop:834 length:240 start_codon:yes stop_codon:yes gene_type:complete